MSEKALIALRERLDASSFERIERIENSLLHRFLAEYVQLCNPKTVFVSIGSDEDLDYIREMAIKSGEERALATPGHTVHFDNYHDQARDKEHTAILVPRGVDLGPWIRTRSREEGLRETHGIMRNIMEGKELYICFFCLGPTRSGFSIPAVQLTDSSYVAHSENILYRQGYGELIRRPDAPFYGFVHSQGELDENRTSKNLDKRRVYIDLDQNVVYSANTQYGGNSIGLKKLAMRLAIDQASKEGWLTEHMLILGVHGPGGRVTYFAGAFPSLCGKTSTAMLEEESIVGDDIAYLRNVGGEARAVNAEKGVFGIIEGVNSNDDQNLWEALHSPGELIFSNVLVLEDGGVYWTGKDGGVPPMGYNHSGDWFIGKRDESGKEIMPSHPNARFTIELKAFENLDPKLDDPDGVPIGAIVYGGRDPDTWVPVEEALNWEHGIITKGASLESETTAATLGEEGVRVFNPMSNLDFLSIPIGRYIQNNLDFGKGLTRVPVIFSVNYFLKDENKKFLNEKTDKKVWYKWMELRVNGDVEAIETPTGRVPKYGDLRKLFGDVLGKDYPKSDYEKQFMIRIPESTAKIDRIEEIYRKKVLDTPPVLFEVLEDQRARLNRARENFGDHIQPDKFIH